MKIRLPIIALLAACGGSELEPDVVGVARQELGSPELLHSGRPSHLFVAASGAITFTEAPDAYCSQPATLRSGSVTRVETCTAIGQPFVYGGNTYYVANNGVHRVGWQGNDDFVSWGDGTAPERSIVLAGGDLFWTTHFGLARYDLANPSIYSSSLAISGASPIGGLASDAAYVYWADASGSVLRWSASPGPGVNPLLTLASGLDHPHAVEIDSARVFWAEDDGVLRYTGKAGGAIASLQNGVAGVTITSIASDNTNVYWTEIDNTPGTGRIRCTSLSGGINVVQVGSLRGPHALAINGTYLYWADADGVKRATRSCPQPNIQLPPGF